MSRRSGQASVEYVLLLASMVVVVEIVGLTISRYGRRLTETVIEKIAEAAISLASP